LTIDQGDALKKIRITAAVSAGLLGLGVLTGCGANNTRDQEDISSWDADYSETYTNGDKYPNTTLQCIRGVAVMTTTRTGAGAWHLVPKLDKFCEQFTQHPVDPSQIRKNG
jgi:hypothetical protein